jgi:hypothetical protein
VCKVCDCYFWLLGRDRLLRVTNKEFTYMRCRSCGASFQSTPPTPVELEQYYPGHYGPYQKAGQMAGRPGFLMRVLRKLSNVQGNSLPRRLESLYQPSLAGLTLLDYGCGSDEVLTAAKQKGWRTIGVDFSPDVVEQVKAAGHEAYLVGENVWREIPDGSVKSVGFEQPLVPGSLAGFGLPPPFGAFSAASDGLLS